MPRPVAAPATVAPVAYCRCLRWQQCHWRSRILWWNPPLSGSPAQAELVFELVPMPGLVLVPVPEVVLVLVLVSVPVALSVLVSVEVLA